MTSVLGAISIGFGGLLGQRVEEGGIQVEFYASAKW